MNPSRRPTPLHMLARAGLFVLAVVLSIALWLPLRRTLGLGVRAVAIPVVRITGEMPTYPDADLRAADGPRAHGPHVGIIVKSVVRDGKLNQRTYVVSLMRWHVNVIVLTALLASLGRMSLIRRTTLLLISVPALLALDGCNVALFLTLAAHRMRGNTILSAATHANLEYGSAVIAPRVLPFLVWLIAQVPGWRRRTSTSAAGGQASRG